MYMSILLQLKQLYLCQAIFPYLDMSLFAMLLLCIVLPYTVWYCQSLYKNYCEARRSGFPLLVCPANTGNVLWIVFAVASRPLLSRCLPSPAYNRIKAAIYGWEFLYRYEMFAWLGPSFILVTPGKNEFWTADPEMASAILTRRNDFLQSEIGSCKLEHRCRISF